jgi:hypothetical protein
MSAFDKDNNFTDPYNTDKFNVPQLLRDSSIQEHYPQEPEYWVLGKHERSFFDEDPQDIEEYIKQNAEKKLK